MSVDTKKKIIWGLKYSKGDGTNILNVLFKDILFSEDPLVFPSR